MIFDTHTHIYLPEFDNDQDEVIARAKQQGVGKMMLPNVDLETIAPLKDTLKRYPDCTIGAMGLHPTSVTQNHKEELQTIYTQLTTSKYYAVGEVGIDLYWDKTLKAQQIIAFEEQLQWAKELNLPAIVHNREALTETLNSINRVGYTNILLHSFGGTPQDVEAVNSISRDIIFGINGVSTFKNSKLDETIKAIGISRIVVETDAPYLTPTPHRGKRNEPSYIVNTVNKIAQVLSLTPTQVAQATTNNATQLFNI